MREDKERGATTPICERFDSRFEIIRDAGCCRCDRKGARLREIFICGILLWNSESFMPWVGLMAVGTRKIERGLWLSLQSAILTHSTRPTRVLKKHDA